MKSILPILFLLLCSFGCQNSTNSLATNEVIVLEHLVRNPQNSKLKSPTLILLHGYGSNEKDLFSLAQHIDPAWLVISARAPMTIEENKYQWYDIDSCLLYTSPSPRDQRGSRMPSSA